MSRLSKWTSSVGVIAIKDMDLNHLFNVYRLIREYAKDRDNGNNNRGFDSIINNRAIHKWVADFKREINRRHRVRFDGQTR